MYVVTWSYKTVLFYSSMVVTTAYREVKNAVLSLAENLTKMKVSWSLIV